jgi:hypothetical protein
MMNAVVKATPAGTIADLDKRPELVLVTDSQDVEAVKDYFGNRAAVKDFDGFLVEVDDGEYKDVFGFEGSVPSLGKIAYKVTRTYSSPKKKSNKKSSKGHTMMGGMR